MLPGVRWCEWVERTSLTHRYAHCRCRSRSHRPAYGPVVSVHLCAGSSQAQVCRLQSVCPCCHVVQRVLVGCSPRDGETLARPATKYLLNAEVIKSTANTSTSKSRSRSAGREMHHHHISIPCSMTLLMLHYCILLLSPLPLSLIGPAVEHRDAVHHLIHETSKLCALLCLWILYTGLV